MPWCCGKPPQGDAEGAECHGGREEARKANTGDSAATSALASLQLPRLLGDAELAHLKRLEQEGDRLLDMSLQEFKLYTRDKKRSMVLFERPVAGTQSKMVRMEAHVAMQPDSLFRLLTSVEGYKILDPYTDNFGQGVVKVLPFPPGRTGHAFINFSNVPPSLMLLAPREGLTCDMVDYDRRLLVSESCDVTHGTHAQPAKGAIRFLIFFTLRVQPGEGRGARLQAAMWMDLCGRVPDALNNVVSIKATFGPILDRLRRHMQQHGLGPDTPPERWPLDEWYKAAVAAGAEGAAAAMAAAAAGKGGAGAMTETVAAV